MAIYLPPSATSLTMIWPIPSQLAGTCALIYDLVAAHRPKLTVCVNTYEAATYITAAQALADNAIDGLIYAATNWSNEEKFLEIQQFSRSHFPSQTYMMREPALACLRHFADQSIDCIVLQYSEGMQVTDWNKTLECWLSKLSSNGIMIAIQPLQTVGNNQESDLFQFKIDDMALCLKWPITPSAAINTIIDLIQNHNGTNFYNHLSHFINNKNKTFVSEKNKLINKLRKQIKDELLANG